MDKDAQSLLDPIIAIAHVCQPTPSFRPEFTNQLK